MRLVIFVIIAELAYVFREEIFWFIVVGKLPLLNISLGPVTMLIFWIFIVPTLWIFRKITVELFWKIIDILAIKTQRRMNSEAVGRMKKQISEKPNYSEPGKIASAQS